MWQSVKNIYHFFVALLATLWYGFPSRNIIVIGITGTDGKTTTTHMVYDILRVAGKKVSMISTIKAVVGGKTYDTGFHVTTPSPIALQKFLKQAVTAGNEYFVIEVSSHALDQNRVAFVRFAVGVLTNIAHEHLDYHKTFFSYANAKFKLLRGVQETVVVPFEGIPQEVLPYADFAKTVKNIIRFGLTKGDETQEKWKFKLKVPGNFNMLNALAAACVARSVGIHQAAIRKALEQYTGIPGRYEEVETGKDLRVVIDFAHKPNALEQVLKTAREQVKKGGRVIVMYGAASERDVLKRPMMGKISARLADITVLTDDDSRFEDPLKIMNEIAAGCVKAGAKEIGRDDEIPDSDGHVFVKVPNRKRAITYILQNLARGGDLILLCGKGHEKSISIKGVEEQWSEHEEVRKALLTK